MNRLTNTVITVSAISILAGCSRNIYEFEIETAQSVCEKHKGLDRMDTLLVTLVICRDGYKSTLPEVKYDR